MNARSLDAGSTLLGALQEVAERLLATLRRRSPTSGQRRLVRRHARRALAEAPGARELELRVTTRWEPPGSALDVEVTVHLTLKKPQ